MGPQPQFSPPSDDPLRKATPAVDDVEARRARAAIEGRLFSGPKQRVKVGRYHVQGRIGSGGMGVVYRAHDPELARDVAVKLMNPEGLGETEADRARRRLVREARAMARLAHPNVIHVYDVGTVEDGVFIAMELVEGQPLSKWITSKPRPWQDVLERFCDAGRGLAAAHAAGVVHRDFKPENVLLGHDGRVRVGDFGLAGAPAGESGPAEFHPSESARGEVDRSAVDIPLTRTGAFLGTPKYMAPEQELGEPADASSDQFSFCVALYEALYGQPPYEGQTVAAYRQSVQAGDVREPPTHTEVPLALHTEIVRGLATEPAQRHESIEALLERISKAADPKPRGTTRRMAVLAAAAIGLAGLAIFAAFGLGEDSSSQPAALAQQDTTPVDTAASPPQPAAAATSVVPQPEPGSEGVDPAKAPPGEQPPPIAVGATTSNDAADEAKPSTDAQDEASTDENAKAAVPVPKPTRTPPRRRRGRDHCYATQDVNKFLGRLLVSRETAKFDKQCYSCREAPSHRVPGLAATDKKQCRSWHICGPVPAEQCDS